MPPPALWRPLRATSMLSGARRVKSKLIAPCPPTPPTPRRRWVRQRQAVLGERAADGGHGRRLIQVRLRAGHAEGEARVGGTAGGPLPPASMLPAATLWRRQIHCAPDRHQQPAQQSALSAGGIRVVPTVMLLAQTTCICALHSTMHSTMLECYAPPPHPPHLRPPLGP